MCDERIHSEVPAEVIEAYRASNVRERRRLIKKYNIDENKLYTDPTVLEALERFREISKIIRERFPEMNEEERQEIVRMLVEREYSE